MKTEYIIEVTKENIQKAIYHSDEGEFNCPITNALNQYFPGTYVSLHSIFLPYLLNNISNHIPIDLPIKVQTFIERFDKLTFKERMQLKEFSFKIEIPDIVIKSINISQIEEILNINVLK